MTTISQYLGEQHRHCDDLFIAAEGAVSQGDWASAERQFHAFCDDTEMHLAREEQVLFPGFEAHTGTDMGPTRVMRMEHEQMRELMGEMAVAIADRNAEAYLGLSETLLILMQQHNMKEEQILYPMVDRVLRGTDGLIERMRSLSGQGDAMCCGACQ